jgi:hypothetical protein
MEPYNRDVALGKEIFHAMKADGKCMLPYRDFVKKWEHLIDWDRFDYEDGETDMHEALLLAVHGFGEAGGAMSFLCVPADDNEE